MDLNNIKCKVVELEKLQDKIQSNFNTSSDLIDANEWAELLVAATKDSYNKIGKVYAEVRSYEMSDLDKRVWDKLLYHIEKQLGKDYQNIRLLDVGTGSGRDIIYASKLGFDCVGVDNSDVFISILENLEREHLIPKKSFVKADMRDLPFDDNSFDVVRQHMSLLHLPIVTKGYMADKAIQENHRILKENGLLYVFAKKGTGIHYIDTNEGLGGRIFQYYDDNSIRNLLERNGFEILEIMDEQENRNDEIINLIMAIARKR